PMIGQRREGMMIRIAGLATFLAAVAGIVPSPLTGTSRATERPVEVMIVGGVHMANTHTSVVNLEGPDVPLPPQQDEIIRMTEGLARFKPTQVHVEREEDVAADYARYVAGELQSDRNEVVQVAFRLAKQLGLTKVHASDITMWLDYATVGAFV